MKRLCPKIILLLLFSYLSSALYAQLPLIQSLTIVPANPTTHDTVKVVCQSVFPSGDCHLTNIVVNFNGSTIDVYATHTLGPLTYICTSIDTISLGKLMEGPTKLRYHLDCYPFPNSTDLDSLNFIVQSYTGLSMTENLQPFSLYPNPAQSVINIQLPDKTVVAEIRITDMQGREQIKQHFQKEQQAIDVSGLTKGVYTIRVSSGVKTGFQKLIKL